MDCCRIGLVLFAALAAGAGCGTHSGNLEVQQNSTTAFDATYSSLRGGWARARVAYTPATTFYEITTSNGTVLVRTGTSLDARQDAPPADARRADGVIRLQPTDAEYPLVAGLLEELKATGANSRPGATGTGTTLYGAAFFAAKALGQVPAVKPGEAVAPLSGKDWPYPGYYDKKLVPAELKVPGEQNGNGGVTCCGPYTCVNADWNPGISCDDWCAAGDACNAWGWGSCGTAMFWPGGGCNSCPHSDSWTIKHYSPSGCNNGTCGVACWEGNPTHYGPASNFDNYGNRYYGSCGGEYGSGCNDHW